MKSNLLKISKNRNGCGTVEGRQIVSIEHEGQVYTEAHFQLTMADVKITLYNPSENLDPIGSWYAWSNVRGGPFVGQEPRHSNGLKMAAEDMIEAFKAGKVPSWLKCALFWRSY